MGNLAVKASEDGAVAHKDMANAIRALAMDAVEKAKSGHPGMPMGMADVATVLFVRFLKFDASAPDWPDRDRFVLSAGHGSMLLYALLHLTGYAGMTMEEIASDVGPSMEMPLSSNRTIRRPSPRWPASEIASWLMPSIRQPSPAIT